MWELDCDESWASKNWCFWTVVLEKTLESPLDCKEIQPVHPKGDQSWVFIGRTDVEAETLILWPPLAKSWLIGKDSDAGRDWGQEKGMTEDEMAGWHHRLDGHESEWTLGVGYGQGGLACCDSWGREESDTTERLNWTELKGTRLDSHTDNWQPCHFLVCHKWLSSVISDGCWHTQYVNAIIFSRCFLSKDVEKLPVDVAWEGICPDGSRKAGKGSLTWILVLPEGFSPNWGFTSPSELIPLSSSKLSSVFLWLHVTPATPTLAKGKNMLSTKMKREINKIGFSSRRQERGSCFLTYLGMLSEPV